MEIGLEIGFILVLLTLFGSFVALFYWLMDGWINPGFAMALMAGFVALMFTSFGFLFIVVLAAVAAAATAFLGGAIDR